MAVQKTDSELIERRKTWKTVSFGGITTYDAFSPGGEYRMPGGKLHMGDIRRIRGHKQHLTPLDFDYLLETVWDDVFVQPNLQEALDMDLWKGYRLMERVVIPHVNVFAYRYLGTSIPSLFFREGAEFVSAGEFLRSVRALSMVKGGTDVIGQLTKNDTEEHFSGLLNGKIEFVDGDFKVYKKDTGRPKPQNQKLFLPGLVRNRLSHPENRFEPLFPDADDYDRATYLLSAIILALQYKDDTPMFA